MIRTSIIITIFLLLSCVSEGMAQQDSNPQALFDQANQQLQNGKITGALNLYNRLEKENYISGALFLNMGVSYIRIDSMGKAKYYFLKSRQFDETRERAQKGLEFVENRFSRQSAVLPTLPWQRALNWLEEAIGSPVLLGIGLLLLNAGIFFYILTWFNKSGNLLSKVSISTAAFGAIIVLLSFYVDYRAERYHRAVMVTRETTVREQPTVDAAVVSQAFEGYTFKVDRSRSNNQDNWSYIQMSNGQYGWIPTKEIMIL